MFLIKKATSPQGGEGGAERRMGPPKRSISLTGGVESLLEPVVRVSLAVERRDLAIAGGSVEADRLGERLVRFESHRPGAVGGGMSLELAEQPAADPEAAGGLRNPHPPDLGGPALELE